MPRRLKLSPLQRDIVMMLEEAGAETVGTVIATLKPSDQGEFASQVDETGDSRFDTRRREQLCADRAGANRSTHVGQCSVGEHGEVRCALRRPSPPNSAPASSTRRPPKRPPIVVQYLSTQKQLSACRCNRLAAYFHCEAGRQIKPCLTIKIPNSL